MSEGKHTMPASVQSKTDAQLHAGSIRRKYRRFLPRPLIDAAAAGLVFALVAAMLTSAPVTAGTNPGAFAGLERAATANTVKAVGEPCPLPIIEIATTNSPSDANAVYRRTSATAAWALLGIAFSLLAALNLALLRHLRRAYATPSRRPASPHSD
jgi:hypothetical protein